MLDLQHILSLSEKEKDDWLEKLNALSVVVDSDYEYELIMDAIMTIQDSYLENQHDKIIKKMLGSSKFEKYGDDMYINSLSPKDFSNE